MNLRTRLALAAAGAAAIVVIGVAVLGVSFARYELREQVDQSLRRQAQNVNAAEVVARQDTTHGDGGHDGRGDADGTIADGGTTGYQLIDATGAVLVGNDGGGTLLPVDADDIAAAASGSGVRLRDAVVEGVHYRIATVGQTGGYAVQVGRPIDDVDRTLNGLTIGFGVLALIGVAAAAALGRFVARRALGPVQRLSAAARDVADTQDPSLPVPESGGAELEQLGRSINTMLRSLADLREHERRLIDDAAHELRTPLTSLRTNIELLSSGRSLTAVDRADLMVDLTEQMEEFSNLVGDLDALARGIAPEPGGEPRPVRLDEIVDSAVRRAQRRAGQISIDVRTDRPGVVVGDAPMIERAVLNVLDNAVKWSPAGGRVLVDLTGTTITVTDHGVGIAPDEVRHVFERFWRAPAARAMPGSGLGLSIVRRVVDEHDGDVTIDANPEGGTRVRIEMPVAAVATG